MKAGKVKAVLICLAPVLSGCLLLVQYFAAPNAGNYTTTLVYPFCVGAVMLMYLALCGVSLINSRIYHAIRRLAPLYCAVFIVLALCDFVSLKTKILSLPFFPWPERLLNQIIIDHAILFDCAKNSLLLLFTGFIYGAAAGILTGILSGRLAVFRYWAEPVLKILGPIPPITWMPFMFIFSRTLFQGCVVMVAFSVWYPLSVSTMKGIIGIKKSYIESAKILGAVNEYKLIIKVMLPLVLPTIFQGLISGMRVACGSLMVAEMMGVESGLAWYITWQRGWGEFTKMYTSVAAICLVFIAVDLLLNCAKKLLVCWQEE
ncbi:MAG: ABC transporter permease subunit [Spirochaetales bacterium]|jgi:NitT/TauT family transport system permease protein|nr:ABC transporter permease subunit [Spirochaetales bacterium]